MAKRVGAISKSQDDGCKFYPKGENGRTQSFLQMKSAHIKGMDDGEGNTLEADVGCAFGELAENTWKSWQKGHREFALMYFEGPMDNSFDTVDDETIPQTRILIRKEFPAVDKLDKKTMPKKKK